MKKLKLLFSLIFVFSLILLVPTKASAVDLTVTCDGQGPCTTSPSSGAALFEENNFLPGDSVNQQVTVINENEVDNCNLTMDTHSETQTPGDFATRLLTVIKQGAVDLFNNSLDDLFESGPLPLGIVGAGSTNVYDWMVTFDLNANNDYQLAETKFDFDLSFECGLVPTPTPTPAGGGDGGGGGGTVAGVSTGGGPSPCTDAKPGTPINFIVTPGPGADQATLSWLGVSPYTSFLIAYSDTPDTPKWGNPDVGNVSSYIVSGLPNGTFYFWVRGQNGCMPGDFAGPVSVVIAGSAAAGLAPGFLPGVLGEATPSGQIQEQEALGEVAGVGEGACQKCVWWPILLGEFVILVIFYWLVLKKYGSRRNYVFSIIIPIAAYLIFLWVNRCFTSSFFCRYFWLLDFVLFIIFIGLVKSWKDLTNSS